MELAARSSPLAMCVTRLQAPRNEIFRPSRFFAVDELAQRLPVEQLGRDVEEVRLAADRQHLDQVLVNQRAGVLDVGFQLRRRAPSTRSGMTRTAAALR